MTEALDVPEDPSDAVLIAAVRRGDTKAYATLYRRHLEPARRAARVLATSDTDREDLIAEAFAQVLRVLRAGKGPVDEFRPYLLVTIRHTAINAYRRDVGTSLHAEVPEPDGTAAGDLVGERAHELVAMAAFATLPERWRTVLWHTAIEGDSPAELAPRLGMTPNGVAALAYRAREGLRQAYLTQYLPSLSHGDCRRTIGRLAVWVRRGLSGRQNRLVAEHLASCATCSDLQQDLVRINNDLGAIAAPVALGAAVAAGVAGPATQLLTAATELGTPSSVLATVKSTMASTACKIGTAAVIVATAGAAPIGLPLDVPHHTPSRPSIGAPHGAPAEVAPPVVDRSETVVLERDGRQYTPPASEKSSPMRSVAEASQGSDRTNSIAITTAATLGLLASKEGTQRTVSDHPQPLEVQQAALPDVTTTATDLAPSLLPLTAPAAPVTVVATLTAELGQ